MGEIGNSIVESLRGLLEAFSRQLPSILGAIALLLVGWLVARLARALAARAMHLFETLLQRATGRTPGAGLRSSATAFSTLIFWVVLLFFVAAATQTLGLVTFTQWLERLLEYLPTLTVGILIIAAGFILARFVGDLTYAAAERLAAPQRTTLARLARGATLFAALLVGADQIGIRVTWIAILLLIVVGALMGGVVLALSLGAREFVANLVGAHYLRQTLKIGESVRVGAHRGRVLDVTATSLVLECDEGRVSLPGGIYHREPIVVTAQEHSKEQDG